MKPNEGNNSEEYWTTAIADFFSLGVKEAQVPVLSLNYEAARKIAQALGVNVEIKGANYVFIKM
ncbi:MAG: hypothetical protein V4628_17785 [Pseudomonadota bacterium]